MKILFLCHRLPYPPKRGGKIRPFNMIRHLARRHRVTVATIARSAEEMAEGQQLRDYCEALHVGHVSRVAGWSRFGLAWGTDYPATFGYFYSASLARTVRTLLSQSDFEAILVHSSSMGPYVAGHSSCRKIMDFGDADSEKWLEYSHSAPFPISLGFRLEGAKVRRYERWLASRFDACSVTAPREREVLASYVRAPIHVFPNGVDLEYFRPQAPSDRRYDPSRVVFTGNMSYKPNVQAVQHFVETILPRLWAERPTTEFYIVGMDPVPAVRRLADGQRVVVTGRVDDIRPFLDSAAVAVAPLRVARGLQNKVLEAMAMRVPVVASPAAFNGIHAVANRDVIVAADAEAFGRGVLKLLGDPDSRERYAAAGRACVETNHNWDRLLPELEQLVVGEAGKLTSHRGRDHVSRTS
jgi:sugar transferase (PEP-CTERM/EpsH1 system associated)